MQKSAAFLVILFVATSLAVCLRLRSAANAEFLAGSDAIRRQAEAVASVTAENERLAALTAQLKTTEALSPGQLRELLRLRGQTGQLRQTLDELPRLKQTNDGLRAAAAEAARKLAAAQAAPNYWPKAQLAFAGYATPEAAIHSMLWIMSTGDLRSWRDACAPEVLAGLEAEWDRHGTSESDRAAEIKSLGAALVSASEGFHILGQESPAPDTTVVNLSFDGEDAARKFVLKRMGNNWKFAELMPAGQ